MFCLSVFSWSCCRRRHFSHQESRSVEKQTQIMSFLNLNSNSGSCHELSTLTKKKHAYPIHLSVFILTKQNQMNNMEMCTVFCMWNCLFPRLSFTCHSGLTRSLMTFLRYYGIESRTKTQRSTHHRQRTNVVLCILCTQYTT